MFDRILIVCTGNICRSPMAEFLLRQRLSQGGGKAEVRSAGIGALVNHPVDAIVFSLMQAKGLDLTPHRGQQVTQNLTRWAELILVMEPHHKEAVVDMDPTARGKTFLLGHWTGQEIPDPYRQENEVYAQSLELIEASIDPWLKKLGLAA